MTTATTPAPGRAGLGGQGVPHSVRRRVREGEYVYPADGEYRRVGHLAILGGGFLVMALHSAVPALVLLLVLKTAIDLGAHLAERRKLGNSPDQALLATTSS